LSVQEVARRIRLVVVRRADLAGLILVLAMTVLARLIPALMLGAEVSDLITYRHMALTVIREQDIYDIHNFFPYTPLSLFIPSFALHLSTVIDQPFHLVMKLFPMVGDVGTAILVFLLARRRWGTVGATLAGLGFAFNPVSILITGFHGNIMPLSVFFAFWAYYLLEAGERRRTYVLSALALGIGIGLRSWPILLLPFLLRPGLLEGWRQRIVYLSLAIFPSALTLAPYLLVNFDGINRELFHYTSTSDFGWMAIWRNLWFLHTGNLFLPGTQTTEWLSRSRTFFLLAYAVLAAAAFLRPYLLDTAGWIAFALILFFTMFGGVAAQYLVWVVPFLALRPYGVVFSLVASGAIVAFYLTYHTGILLGPYPSPIEYSQTEIHRVYGVFLVVLWMVGAVWLLWVLVSGLPAGPVGGGRPVAGMGVDSERPPGRPVSGRPVAPRMSWVTLATVLLTAGVLLTFGLEMRYIVRIRPAPEVKGFITRLVDVQGSDAGKSVVPLGRAVDSPGDTYVADLGNARVQRLSSAGAFLSLWPATAEGQSRLAAPSDVAVGDAGEVYVRDAAGTIYRLNRDGNLGLPPRFQE
jgi:hypothetical protein